MGIRDRKPRTITCRKCGLVGPPERFKKASGPRRVRENICRPCDYKTSKEWRAKNPERTREQLAEQYWRDPGKQRNRDRERYKVTPKEYRYAIRNESRHRLKRGQAHWQRTSRGVLIGRMVTPKKSRAYIKERLVDD